MPFVPKLLGEYRECEKALKEAEWHSNGDGLDYTESFNYAALAKLEKILSADTNAMAMLRYHREYGQRLPVVLERITKLRKDSHGFWPSEPAYLEKPLVEPVSDAEMIEGNWAQCVAGCKAKSLEIATLRQIAELRIKHGKDSAYCAKGGWVAENFNYLPDGDILVASHDCNPLLKYAEDATNAHIANNEFYLDDRVVEGLFEGVKQGGVFLLKREDVPDKISVDSFGKEPLTAFLGWDKNYGEFLNNCGIKKVRLYVANNHKQAFSRAPWAGNLGDDSALDGDDSLYGLSGDCGRAFGVRRPGEQSGTGSTGAR